MITQKQMDKLFNTATEVGVASAIELLENMRDRITDYDGKFIDGFDYAVRVLRKTNEVMSERDE